MSLEEQPLSLQRSTRQETSVGWSEARNGSAWQCADPHLGTYLGGGVSRILRSSSSLEVGGVVRAHPGSVPSAGAFARQPMPWHSDGVGLPSFPP